MGLMRLLTVGRSWSEVKNEPHRYKLRTDGWPRFGYEAPPAWKQTTTSSKPRVETEMKTETMTANSDVVQAFPRGRWTLGAKPAPRARPAAVQGELSLDRVKPVRNDLSDTDLELVPAKPVVKVREPQNVFAAPMPTPAPAAAAATPVPPKESWFSRLTTRLFKRKAR